MSSPCRNSLRRNSLHWVGLLLLEALLMAPAARAEEPLRLCVEPANLPFADAAGGGFDVAVARLLAGRLGRELVVVPVAQGFHGYTRRTLGEGLCDLLAGMPTRAEGALTTRPYYRSTWVFVVRDGVPVPASFDDPRLTGWRIAVPVAGQGLDTPPVAALARRGLVDRLERFPVAARDQGGPLRAVAAGNADLAIVWGPVAGWYAARAATPLALGPTPDRDRDIPFTASTALAVQRDNAPLRDALNRVLASERDAVAATLAAWHVPTTVAAGG
jgi:mxaJ protein